MVSVSLVLSRVRASPSRMCSSTRASKGARSPTTMKRMPFEWSLPISCSRERRKSCMRNETSSGGRRQFSLEKAKSVRYSTPLLAQAFTTARTASTPRRCPATRGRKRFFAQRPLPSMMIATWRGTVPASGIVCVELAKSVILASRLSRLVPSYRHQILLFVGDQLVDVGDRLVGEFLDLDFGALVLVLAYLALLQQRLHVRDRIAADVAHRDLGILALVLHDFGELLAALLGERGHRNANDIARGGRIHAQVGVADGLLDHRDHLLLERLDRDGARVGKRDVGDLVDRHFGAVIVDAQMIAEAGVRAAGAHLGEVVLQSLD